MITVLSGSPRPGKVTTRSLAQYLSTAIGCELLTLRDLEKDPELEKALIGRLKPGHTLVIVHPVYLDAPPAQLLSFMARVADQQVGGSLALVVHSGYPEPAQRAHSKRVAQALASEAGLTWLGAIGFGATPPIGGRPLEELGFYTKHIRAALSSMAQDLLAGKPLSDETHRIAMKHGLPVPSFLAPVLMNFVVRKRLKDAGVKNYKVMPWLNRS